MKKSDKKHFVYMICGFIGAGKTTFAKKLEKETGALRFTKDEWIIKIFGNNPTFDQFDKYDERISRLCFDVAFECLKAGNDIILDDGFWVRSQRDEIRNRIKKAGANFKVYYLKCSDNTMKQRVLKRSTKPTKTAFHIDSERFESYKKYFEELDADEEHTVVKN